MGAPVPGNIPWWQIRLWAQDHDMTRTQFLMLDVCIRKMDETYRAYVREKIEQDQKTLQITQRSH
jgi:hypothetical protein